MKTRTSSSFAAWRWALALPLLAACLLAFGQPMPGPDVRHDQGVAYVTGGIGERGHERVQALGKGIGLELIVTATFDGRSMERTVTVPDDGHRRVVFHWPGSERVSSR